MAGFDYGRMQNTASRLLRRFKQGTVTFTMPGTTTPGANPWDPPIVNDPVTHPLDATVKGVSAEFVDGTTILATDLELTVAVFGAALAPPDQFAIDGQVVTVIKAMQIPAAGIPLVWRFIVRG